MITVILSIPIDWAFDEHLGNNLAKLFQDGKVADDDEEDEEDDEEDD